MGGLLIVGVVLGIYLFLEQPDAATFAPLVDARQRRTPWRLRRLPERQDR